MKIFLNEFYFLFSVLVITTRAYGEDNQIDTREGEDVTLQCRFSPDHSDDGFVYYWATISNEFENVAFENNSLKSAYK